MHDTFTRAGAQSLVRRILGYWRSRGYIPAVYAEKFLFRGEPLWQVRSDMLNGKPDPNYTPHLKGYE